MPAAYRWQTLAAARVWRQQDGQERKSKADMRLRD